MIEIVRLCRDSELRVEWPVGFAIAEHVDGECGAVRRSEYRTDVSPEKAAGAESVYEDDRRAAVSVSLDMQRPGADRNS